MFNRFTFNQELPYLIAFALLLFSMLFYFSEKKKAALSLLFLGAFVMGYAAANMDSFLNMWDEPFHALVAKNMMAHPFKPMLYTTHLYPFDYKDWTGNMIWLHKQPLFLWQMALSLKLFGINELAVRLPSVLMFALTALLIYRIGKLTLASNLGYFAALLFICNNYFLELIVGRWPTEHNDVCFTFYVCASFWAWFEYSINPNQRRWILLIGVFAGAAVLTKWLLGLLIFPVWFLVIIYEQKQLLYQFKHYKQIAISFGIALLVFLPWQFYILNFFPLEASNELTYNALHFSEVLENHGGDALFHFNALSTLYGSGDAMPYLIIAGFILLIVFTKQWKYKLTLALPVIIVYTFYTIAATKMLSYCLVVSPFIFLGLATLLHLLLIGFHKLVKRKWIITSIAIPLLGCFCFLLMDINMIQQYHTYNTKEIDFSTEANLKTMKFIESLKTTLKDKKCVVFYTNFRMLSYIKIMFYTNYLSYYKVPSITDIYWAKKNGYVSAIFDDGQLPQYIYDCKEIIKMK